MVCLGSTNLTVYLLNENICWKWLGRKPAWKSSASGICLKPKQQLSSIDLKPSECVDEDAVYLASAWRSKGPNSGSCWTEPVHALPTVISSVGTGGWAQSSSLFLPLSSQSQKNFWQLVHMDKNPVSSYSQSQHTSLTLYWICCCVGFPCQGENIRGCIVCVMWLMFPSTLCSNAWNHQTCCLMYTSVTAVSIMVP